MGLVFQQTQVQKASWSSMWVTSKKASTIEITHFGKMT